MAHTHMILSDPLIFLPGTLCDERVFMPCWRNMNLAQRAFVPLQWAESLQQMLMLTGDRAGEFNQPCHLVGFSMGGFVASLYALEHPDQIASLTLIGYCSEGLDRAEKQQRQQVIQSIQRGKYRGMTSQRMEQLVHNSKTQDPLVSKVVQQMSDDLGAGVLKAQSQATIDRTALTTKLAKTTFPIHLIAAEHDRIAPLPSILAMQQQLTNCSLDVIDGAGHMMLLEQPEKLANILNQRLSD